MRHLWLGAGSVLTLALAGCAPADPRACAPTFSEAVVRVMPVDMPMQAGYVTVANSCPRPIDITAVQSPDWQAISLHTTQEVNGVAKMREAKTLTVPAHGTLRMSPGGTHLMLESPTRKLVPGNTVILTLTLADGRHYPVPFTLQPL